MSQTKIWVNYHTQESDYINFMLLEEQYLLPISKRILDILQNCLIFLLLIIKLQVLSTNIV